MSRADERVCDLIDRELRGTSLTWALVLWMPGREGYASAVAISSPPSTRTQVETALHTAAEALSTAKAAAGALSKAGEAAK